MLLQSKKDEEKAEEVRKKVPVLKSCIPPIQCQIAWSGLESSVQVVLNQKACRPKQLFQQSPAHTGDIFTSWGGHALEPPLVGTASQDRLEKVLGKPPGWSHCWGHVNWSSSGTEDLQSEGQRPWKSAVVANTPYVPFFFHSIKLLTVQNKQNPDNMLQWIPTFDMWQAIQQST